MSDSYGTLNVLSYGGGLDSWAMLLLALDRGELPDLVVFADVADPEHQDPGEWPSTYRHINEVVKPLCQKHGIPFVTVSTDQYPIRASKKNPAGFRSLMAYFEHTGTMPTRMTRLCTVAAKVERIRSYLNANYPGRPICMWLGFEAGEENRAAKDPHAKAKKGAPRTSRFPLIEAGLCRCRCEDLAKAHGLPVPRKSACVFCPFASRVDFQTLAQELPTQFERVAAMEQVCKPTKKTAKKESKILRYGYKKGDGTDPNLRTWIAKPFKPQKKGCPVCGAAQRASKRTGCDYLCS